MYVFINIRWHNKKSLFKQSDAATGIESVSDL